MAYATKDDIDALYGTNFLEDVADRDADGNADIEAIELALKMATSEIDTYIGARHAVPLAAPTDSIKQICVDIAIYKMAIRATALTEEMRQRYEDAIAWLAKAASGKVSLGTTPLGEDEEPATTPAGKMFFGTLIR